MIKLSTDFSDEEREILHKYIRELLTTSARRRSYSYDNELY